MKLKQFYSTTSCMVPFNNLSVESRDILENSAAYKRYCRRINWKAIGNYILVGIMAVLLAAHFINEALLNM